MPSSMTLWRRANPEKARAHEARNNARPERAHAKWRWTTLRRIELRAKRAEENHEPHSED